MKNLKINPLMVASAVLAIASYLISQKQEEARIQSAVEDWFEDNVATPPRELEEPAKKN